MKNVRIFLLALLTVSVMTGCSPSEEKPAAAKVEPVLPIFEEPPPPTLELAKSKKGLEKAQIAFDVFELAQMENNKSVAAQALALVSEALKEEPANAQILLIRYHVRKDLFDYDGALQDLRRYNKAEKVADLKLFECFLQERMTPATPPMDCYNDALVLFEARDKDDLNNQANILFIKRLLDSPDLTPEINAYLAANTQLEPEDKDQFRNMMNKFDRNRIIRFYFPDPTGVAHARHAAP